MKLDIKGVSIELLRNIYHILLNYRMKMLNKRGEYSHKVIFTSFSGKSYSDNSRAISEALHNLDKTIDIVWIFNSPSSKKGIVPSYVRTIPNKKKIVMSELSTARVWVDNFIKVNWLYKSDKQMYIQTWHGDRAIKKILHDSGYGDPDRKFFEEDNCDLFIAASDSGIKMCRSAFHYKGEIMCEGSPRNDDLINNMKIISELTRDNLGIKRNVKVLLFAPTLRRKPASSFTEQSVGDIDIIKALSILEEVTGCTWICAVRAHAAVAGLTGLSESDKIMDVTHYEDMKDLLCMADMLITDYSSSSTDFQLTGKPMILYQSDRSEYLKYDRSFYFDLDSSPFLIAKSMDELVSYLKQINEIDFEKIGNELNKFFGVHELGNASIKVAERILAYLRDCP